MKILYIISTILLILSFLIYKKNTNKLSIISWIIYSISLLLCFNILIVFILSYLNIKSTFLILSIISLIISIVLIYFSKGHKQKYYFDLKELITLLLIISICLAICLIRTKCLTAIPYETTDSAIHYKAAAYFSKEHMILNETNSTDIVYNNFHGMMNASYINGGILIDLLSNFKPYIAFMIFDFIILILSACMIFVTIFNYLDKKYFYCGIATCVYILSFPLNNMVFGFFYLGLGVLMTNLLIYTMNNIKLKDSIILNITIITMITFGIFNSYYLFMPPIYLGLGIYYIYNYKKKRINIKELFFYGIITLILPFVIGFCYYMLPSLIDNNDGTIFNAINIDGYIYYNKKAIYLFILGTIFFVYKNKLKINFYSILYFIYSIYLGIFTLLYLTHNCQKYYYSKLYYLYFLLLTIYIVINVYRKRSYVYLMLFFILFSMINIYFTTNYDIVSNIYKLNIYNWNASLLRPYYKVYNKEGIELLEQVKKVSNECIYNSELLLVGNVNSNKNMWYYSITNLIPVPDNKYNRLHTGNLSLKDIEELDNYKCVVYLYSNSELVFNDIELYFPNYNILYENNIGSIIKKK